MSQITITPLSPSVGARIEGIAIDRPLTQANVDLIQNAVYRYGLVLFSRVSISEDEQVRFANYFGGISKVGASGSQPDAVYVSNAKQDGILGNSELDFHSDKFYLPDPPKAAMLYAIELPASGGETLFANTNAVVRGLNPTLRERLQKLTVRHHYAYHEHYGSPDSKVSSKPLTLAADRVVDIFDRPVIAQHPWSDAHCLTVSSVNVKGILGVSDEESRALIDQISALIAAPEYVYQHRWQVGDLIFWDNFLLQHARTPFNSAEKRTLRRCQIAYL